MVWLRVKHTLHTSNAMWGGVAIGQIAAGHIHGLIFIAAEWRGQAMRVRKVADSKAHAHHRKRNRQWVEWSSTIVGRGVGFLQAIL